MKIFFRIVIGIAAVLFALGFIASGTGMIFDGRDFFSWGPLIGFGVPLLYGGLGLIFNWFSKEDFNYWPF